jgi:hypothetical protein
MKKNKKVFILLFILALFFIFGLGTNFFSSKNRGSADSYDRKNSWVSSMDNLMSKFYPALDPKRLVPVGNSCRVEDGAYVLETDASCKFFIKRLNGEDYQTATFKVDKRVTVRVAITDDDYEGECQSAPDLNKLELLVNYFPSGESKKEPICWTTSKPGDEVRLVAMEKGGQLFLSCPTCDDSKQRRIRVEIR